MVNSVSGAYSMFDSVNSFRKLIDKRVKKLAQSPTVVKEVQSNSNPAGTGIKVNIYV
ncbi:MAG: hypothetical protein HQK97_02970 [Nitrospirae bacterium]|nr:hypothetical protein [Nitrospirota bacterium]